MARCNRSQLTPTPKSWPGNTNRKYKKFTSICVKTYHKLRTKANIMVKFYLFSNLFTKMFFSNFRSPSLRRVICSDVTCGDASRDVMPT